MPQSPDAGTPPPSAPPAKRRRLERQRADVTYPRRRAVRACKTCRVKKVKCNNARPICGMCAEFNATCIYDDSTEDCSSYDPASIAILDRLSQVVAELKALKEHTSTVPRSVSPAELIMISPHVSQQAQAYSNPVGDSETVPDDFTLQPASTSADAILTWPMLAGPFPATYIADGIFEAEANVETLVDTAFHEVHLAASSSGLSGILENDISKLVRRFLELVHPKNPVLDVGTLWSYAQGIAENGLRWNGASCLVLLACALGCVARPFTVSHADLPVTSKTSLEAHKDDLARGNAYYNIACRRIGVLEKGLIGPQCHFLSGLYLVYTLKPLRAWSEFEQASRMFFIYWRHKSRQLAQVEESAPLRRLEGSIYWSCYKSGVELLLDIHLPQSCLADLQGIDLFPSPLDPHFASAELPESPLFASSSGDSTTPANSRIVNELRHSQEQSWYYYITEITLRRIHNRTLNLLYRDGHAGWNEKTIGSLPSTVTHLEEQIHEWSQNFLPIVNIDADTQPEEEVPFMMWGRFFEFKCLIYRPFLFYATHYSPDAPHQAVIAPLVEKALSLNIRGIQGGPHVYRHYGTWFHIRGCVTAALCVLAAVKSGNVAMVAEMDWRDMIRHLIDRLQYWKDEGPGVSQSIEVLETLMASMTAGETRT
ncbi:hypothetical protein EDB80DRAFT_732121 [Ilyonectria destructans]|nr:hypothetical protein EDB80DRAFT_732121 [Ilyonectria destructans]